MSATSTVLITGANRGPQYPLIYLYHHANHSHTGIGRGFVTAYLNRPYTTVIATVRRLSTAESLASIPKAAGSRLIVIEMEFTSTDSIHRGIASLTSQHKLDSLDIVLANAGIANMNPTLSETEVSQIQRLIDVNAFGQLELFKAVAPLLLRTLMGEGKGKGSGKFMYMSSSLGSLTNMSLFAPTSAYGASKALGNYLFKWLALEQQDIIVWAQHPG